jgi:hypothetical protein
MYQYGYNRDMLFTREVFFVENDVENTEAFVVWYGEDCPHLICETKKLKPNQLSKYSGKDTASVTVVLVEPSHMPQILTLTLIGIQPGRTLYTSQLQKLGGRYIGLQYFLNHRYLSHATDLLNWLVEKLEESSHSKGIYCYQPIFYI